MKNLLKHAVLLLLFTSPLSITHAQNVQSKSPTVLNLLPAGEPDVLRVQNGLLSHRVAGTIGQFGAGDQWIGIGAPLSSLYGERTQWNGQAFIKALRSQNPSVPAAIKDAIIEWGNQGGEMQFRYITNPSSPTGFISIHTLTSAGNAYYGQQPSVFGITPRVGIGTSNQPCISGRTNDANAAEFISGGSDFSNVTGVIGFIKTAGQFTSNYGVKGIVSLVPFQSFNVGVYGEVSQQFNDIKSTNYSVFGNSSNVGTSYAGYFQGDVFTTGLYLGSDARLKQNVTPEENIMDKVRKLRPVTYTFKSENFKGYNLPLSKQHGFIAQELQQVFPELVRTNRYVTKNDKGAFTASEEFLAVNYQGLIPVLYKALQEQQAQIDELKAALNELKNAGAVTDSKADTKPDGVKSSQFSLSQNTPNPFSSTTTIRYTIPDGISNAAVGIFDLNGRMLLQYNNLRGSSQLVINGSTLQPGIYIYSLLAEGQEVLTKRMILTK